MYKIAVPWVVWDVCCFLGRFRPWRKKLRCGSRVLQLIITSGGTTPCGWHHTHGDCSATIWRTAEEIACWSYATDWWRGHEEDVARGKWDYWRFHWSHEPLAVYSCNPQLHWSIQGGLNDIEHGGNGLHKKRECEQDEENCKRFFKDFLETYHVLEKEPFLHNFETRQMVQRIWQRRRKRCSLCPWPTFQMMAKAMLYIILNDWKLLKDAAMRLAALSGVISTLKTAL